MTGFSPDDVIEHVANRRPAPGHRISFMRLDGTRSLDLAELHESAGRLALRLSGLGIGPGDRIGILAANCLEWVLLDLAALRLNAVTAGFEPGKFAPESALLERYGLATLFTDRPYDDPGIRPISEVGKLLDDSDTGDELPPAVWGAGDVTTIKFTSGSTGEPKGLGATVGSVDASVTAVQGMFEHGPDDNLFLFLPLSLIQQRYWIYSALRYGHDVTVSTYETALPALRQARPTVVMGVPAFYETAKKHIEGQARRADADVPEDEAVRAAARKLFGDRIRYLWTGSAPARAPMLRFFELAGLPIFEGYGLNETCIVAKNHPGCPAQTHLVAVVSPSADSADEAAIHKHVARSNAALGHDEQIRKIVIAHPRFSVDNGLLTSQFKPRRPQILDRYRADINAPLRPERQEQRS